MRGRDRRTCRPGRGSPEVSKADFAGVQDRYPSTKMGEKEWVEAFDRNPDMMWAIIGDVYDAVKVEQERDAGRVRIGRRPARAATSLDDVYATVFPAQYTMDPFTVALAKLMAGKSQRAFAPRIPCDQGTLSRLLSGRMVPDLIMLERISEAAKVSPYFFVEYRSMYVGQLITRVLTERPNMGVAAVKKLRASRSESARK